MIIYMEVKMSLKVEKRRNELVSMINLDGTCYISEAAKLFKVTHETIRNDFDFLVREHGYERIHGGIKKSSASAVSSNYDFHQMKVVRVEEKKRICFTMMDMIHDGDCIYVDSGSTVTYILNFLNSKRNLTIVTPSIAFLMKYIIEGHSEMFEENRHEFIFVGGKVNSSIQTSYGTFFNEMMSDIHFDKAIFSCDAVDLNGEVMNADETAYAVIRKAINQSKKRFLLADASKFDEMAKFKAVKFNEVDYLITEESLNEKWQDRLNQSSVKYIKA